MKLKKKLVNMNIRGKLSLLIIGSMLLLLVVNLFMYFTLNRITKQMDQIYIGNVQLNELEDSLDTVQTSMVDYLNTKSTDSLDEYYRAAQGYQNLLDGMGGEITDNQLKLHGTKYILYVSEGICHLLRIL